MSNEDVKKTQETDLTVSDPTKEAKSLVSVDEGQYSMYLDKAKFEHIWRVSNMFAQSDLVPDQYKNKPNNCMLAFNMATRLSIDPLMLMQKTYVIKGKPAMESQLVIALMNAKGPFKGPVTWTFEGEGEDRKCTASAVHKVTGQVCEATVTWKMAKLEGWTSKAGSKWMTMPDQMFRYRSAVFLARLYCPEVIIGFQTVDEVEDISTTSTTTNTVQAEAAEPTQQPVSGLEERLTKPVEATVTDTAEKPSPETPKKDKKKPDKETKDEDDGAPSTAQYTCNACGSLFYKPTGKNKDQCPICLDIGHIEGITVKEEEGEDV